MDVLLDSHILLWALTNDHRLSEKAKQYILNPDNLIYYSIASIWELSVKHMLHPENIGFAAEELLAFCEAAGFEPLDIRAEHVLAMETLKRPDDAPKHKDPFDKMLIAQAKAENCVFLTHDELLPDYNERCIVSV